MDNVTTTRRPGRLLVPVPSDASARGASEAETAREAHERRRHGLAASTRQAAASRGAVILIGEDSVGKERLARDIHRRSAHAAGPFVMIQCAGVPAAELESELFGHIRLVGDAIIRQRGAFERAQSGTLYLDDLAELPAGMQQALAAAVARGRLPRQRGHDRAVVVELRLIASCDRARIPAAMLPLLGDGALAIDLPPLRDRAGEALALANAMLGRLNTKNHTTRRLSPRSLRFTQAYRWPGNVAELENAVHRAYAQAVDDQLDLESAASGERGRAVHPVFATLDVDLTPADLAWIGDCPQPGPLRARSSPTT